MDPEATRAAILTAARTQFGENGFDRTTIRSVAGAAGVDPALVMHYFRNKHGLFTAAAQLRIQIPDLSGVEPEEAAGVLVPLFASLWGPDGPLLPLLRAAASNTAAAETLRDVFLDHVRPGLSPLAKDRPEQRISLIGAHLVGIAVARHIIGIPALADLTDDELIGWLTPVFAHYLAGPLPGEAL
ncbi:TetR family transcriptional regulator [Kineosporia succinea]